MLRVAPTRMFAMTAAANIAVKFYYSYFGILGADSKTEISTFLKNRLNRINVLNCLFLFVWMRARAKQRQRSANNLDRNLLGKSCFVRLIKLEYIYRRLYSIRMMNRFYSWKSGRARCLLDHRQENENCTGDERG